MKKNIILTSLFLMLLGHAFGQNAEYPGRAMSITGLPSTIKTISYSDVSNLETYYKHIYLRDSPVSRLYRSGNVLISVSDIYVPLKPFRKTLEATREEAERSVRKDPIGKLYGSEIITVNNNRYLIIRGERGGDQLIRFYSEFNNLYVHVYGIIEYKEVDKGKAEWVLKTLLDSMNFIK